MEEGYNGYYEEEYAGVDIFGLIDKFTLNWKKIIKWTCFAGLLGLVIAFSIPKSYTSSARLAPEIAQKSSSMNSLAALAGINLNNVAVTDAMYPDLYPEIIRSIPFKIELFSMPVDFVIKKDTVKTDLYDYMLNYTKKPWWTYVIAAPSKCLSWVKGLFREKREPVKGYDNVNSFKLTGEQWKVLKTLGDCIEVAVDKKTYVITVAISTNDPRVSADLCQLVVANLKEYVVDYRTEKARHDLEYYQQLYDDAKKDYFDAQQRYARYVDANQGIAFQRVLIERERLQNEANLKYQVYNATAQQLQNAKAKVQLETPVFATLQPPTVPLKSSKPSKVKIILVMMFLGFFSGLVWFLFGRDFVEKARSHKDEEPETSTEA